MSLIKEMMVDLLAHETVCVVFPGVEYDLAKVLEGRCYQTLEAIKAVLEDDSLSDPECFQKIEAIVCAFERLGSGGGGRHDFG